MNAFPLVWFWRKWPWLDLTRPPGGEWKGRRCRALARGKNGNTLVEFENGELVVAPFYAVRRARG